MSTFGLCFKCPPSLPPTPPLLPPPPDSPPPSPPLLGPRGGGCGSGGGGGGAIRSYATESDLNHQHDRKLGASTKDDWRASCVSDDLALREHAMNRTFGHHHGSGDTARTYFNSLVVL